MRVRDINRVSSYGHVIIAPHLDDAVLSFGGTIALLTSSGERVLVLTICAGLPPKDVHLGRFARELSKHAPTPPEYVLMRREEDRRALETVGADWFWDSALDAIYRYPEHYGDTRAQIFGRPIDGDTLIARAVSMTLLAAELAPHALVYAPLAIGEHVDHAIIAAGVRRAVEPERVGWYEDFPYVLRRGLRERRLDRIRKATGELLEAESIDITTTLSTKIDAIACYETQIESLFGDKRGMRRAVISHAGGAHLERLWVSPRNNR